MKLSIVATLYQSAPYVHEFYARCTSVAQTLCGAGDYEILLVNDGSPDASLELAAALSRSDPHVVVLDLSRNFGHHKAMMTGLAHAQGEFVFLIDSDLEEEPEYLYSFMQRMQQERCDVVYGVQEQRRKGKWFERWSGQWFYRFFRLMTGVALPENVLTARLMTRAYVAALVQHGEREVFMAGLLHITGFQQVAHGVTKLSRGTSTYTLRKKMALFVNSITSFSNAPLVSIFYIGVIISVLASSYIAYLLARNLFFDAPLAGWTSIMASLWLLGGMIISFIGVVGIYLSKIFSETKQRPYTIIKAIHAQNRPQATWNQSRTVALSSTPGRVRTAL